MTPRTVPIVCAKAPRYIAYVPAIRKVFPKFGAGRGSDTEGAGARNTRPTTWRCSYCGQRVKVVA